jgi:hypothetical protein
MGDCVCGHEYEYHAPQGGECDACDCIRFEEADDDDYVTGYSRSDLLFGGNW